MTSAQLRKSQADAREKLNRVNVIHRTVVLVREDADKPYTIIGDDECLVKKTIAGPYQCNFSGKQTKAEKKAMRRHMQVKNYYAVSRQINSD